MVISIKRLDATERSALVAHFLALPTADRWLRFGRSVAPEVIVSYVDGIDFARDAVFGIHADRLALVGVAHVAFDADGAEVALSVLPAHRAQGLGGALFERVATHVRNRRASLLRMRFVVDNDPVARIARRFRMRVVKRAGETDARLDLLPASLPSIAAEFVTDAIADCADALNAAVTAWRTWRDRTARVAGDHP